MSLSTFTSPTPWVVQKFGGTSVGKFPQNICEIIKMYSENYRVVAVCSARSTGTKAEGTTTRLLNAAHESTRGGDYLPSIEAIRKDHLEASHSHVKSPEIVEKLVADINRECDDLEKILSAAQVIDEISPRTLDTIMSAGEKLSCIYMAAILNDAGVPAKYVDLSRVIPSGVDITKSGLDNDFYRYLTKAMVKALDPRESAQYEVPVVTGFFGVIPGGLLNGVGRGYTDLCAALLSVGLEADELQVWKEVDGIFTADPRKVPCARLLDRITPEEASELTYYGSEVIHPFTMEQVIRARIPIRIKNVMNSKGDGTVIFPDNNSKRGEETPPHPPVAVDYSLLRFLSHGDKLPTAVTTKSNIIVLNVHSNKKKNHSHGFLAQVFTILDRWKLVVDLISTSEVHISMALHSTLSDNSLKDALDELKDYGSVDVTKKLCIVSLVGKSMKQSVGTAGKMFTTLAEANINIEMISQGASEINISCVVDEKDAVKALNVLHEKVLDEKRPTSSRDSLLHLK